MIPEKPTAEDHVKAKAEYIGLHGAAAWDALRTQSKNRLAKEQMYHRNYHALCDAISPKKD